MSSRYLVIQILLAWLFACDDIDTTTHRIAGKNTSSINLYITYQTIDMDSAITEMVSNNIEDGIQFGEISEKGNQGSLETRDLINYFEVFQVFSETDTFSLTPSSKEWQYFDGGVDTGGRVRGYVYEISDSDLNQYP